MSPQSKREYLLSIWLRYQKASRKQKSQILSEVCTNLGFNRKYAIRWLRNWKPQRRQRPKNKPGPKPQYQHRNSGSNFASAPAASSCFPERTH